ncbi:MAG: beta galactosidase jelly roll domain-containing protein [Reichenbachiella sp.]
MIGKKLFIILTISFALCHLLMAQSGEERISLNGDWKFNALLGEGSNSLDIKPEKEDILIDNSQEEHLVIKGNWELSTEPQRGSKCWGESYLHRYFNEWSDSSYVRFKTAVPKSGYYQHFIYYPWGHHNATIINVKHADGVHSWPFSQRNRPNTWLNLGVFKIDIDQDNYVEFTSHTKNMVSADVVMFRPISEEDYLATLNEKQELVKVDYDDSDWELLKVPGHFGMINEFSNYSGKAWYRKELSFPESWQKSNDERIRIRFEGVYHVAKVYLNGKYLGHHQGGFTPFEFDITDKINFEGNNILAVEANNDYTVGATWNWGGIIRDVTLIKNKNVRVNFQYIHAEPDLEKGTAKYGIKIRIENSSEKQKTLDVEAVIVDDLPLTSSSKRVVVEALSTKEFQLNGFLTADQVQLWHFDQPKLYQLETSIREGETLLHKKNDHFGIRRFEATKTQMLLNGEPVRLVGFNRVSDHRYWGSSEPLELLKLDVDLMKNAGANFMRIMHGTQNEKLVELCDKKGILLFEEANIRNLRNPQFQQPDFGMAKIWIKEMFERDANHPSIVGWSVGNELDDHWDYVKDTYQFAKELDPNRMALHVSNRGYRTGEDATNNPLNHGDMIFQNIYQKDPGKVMDTIRARWPNRAMFISEFGWADLSRFKNERLENTFEELGQWYNYLREKRNYITGASIWTFNDYRSGYTMTLPSENRAWGMVNAWRTKRRYWYTHLNENSPAKELEIDNINLKKRKANVELLIRDKDDFPSFTMKNYVLNCIIKDQKGVVLTENQQSLPPLIPGMDSWKGEISWDKYKGEAFELHVSLVTPNGYTRREKRIHFDVPVKPEIDQVKTSDYKLRIHYKMNIDAFEYFLRYSIEGIEKTSYKTLTNYIDLDSLPKGKKVSLQLIAMNSKGESVASNTYNVETKGPLLAPIIWDGFIADNKLVVGYSGAWEDETYTVRYGTNKENLDQYETSNTRGMITVPLNGEKSLYFQIMRTTSKGDSQWSNIVNAKEGKFRIYE